MFVIYPPPELVSALFSAIRDECRWMMDEIAIDNLLDATVYFADWGWGTGADGDRMSDYINEQVDYAEDLFTGFDLHQTMNTEALYIAWIDMVVYLRPHLDRIAAIDGGFSIRHYTTHTDEASTVVLFVQQEVV